MEDFPNLPILSPSESLKTISSSQSSRAQKLLSSSLVTQALVYQYRYPDSGNNDLLILDVTHFLDHRVNTRLVNAIGEELAETLTIFAPNLILTAPSAGNFPAFAVAANLEKKPDVLYVPKGLPFPVHDSIISHSTSLSHGKKVPVAVARDCLPAGARVVICDDFLDRGQTALELIDIVKQAGATVVALAFAVEKPYTGRRNLINAGFDDSQIISLIRIDSMRLGKIKLRDFPFWFEMTRKE